MDWFVAAIVSAVALSGQALFFQQLQRLYPVRVYLTYVWLGAAFVLALIFLRPADLASIQGNIVPLVVAGLSSWGGIYAYNRAIQLQTNIGYIEAAVALRIAITYVFSLWAFSAVPDVQRLIGIALIMLGVMAVTGGQTLNLNEFRIGWLRWALVGAVLFAALTIAVRYATDGGVSAEVATVVVLVVAGLLFLVSCRTDGTSLRVQRPHWWIVLTAIGFATVGNAAEFISFQTAPNLAYPSAIDNSRIIILYIVGLFLFSERLQRTKAIGIVVTFVGVILLS